MELMFFFKTGWLRFIKRLSFILSKYFLFPYDTMVNSSKKGLLSHCKKWSRFKLSLDESIFLKVSGDFSICSPDQTFKCLYVFS